MEYIYIGKTNGTHGLKGELKLKTNFTYKDRVLTPGFNYYLGKEKQNLVLEKSRKHNDIYLITFKDYNDINLVQNLKNKDLYINKEDLNLKKNEFVHEDYLNLECYFKELYLGKIVKIENCGGNNYVFLIKGEKEILIPLNHNFIAKIEKNDKIIFKEVEGLIDAN